MNKYLIYCCDVESSAYLGFESDKSEDELNLELKEVKDKCQHKCYFNFKGFTLYKNDKFYFHKVISLDTFWKNSLTAVF